MSIKGTLDPIFIDGGTSAVMRESNRYHDVGWWGVDDNHVPHIGPYESRETCKAACDQANQEC